MDGMSGMSSTFSASTRVTLWFTDWTTETIATYVLAVFFLFFLGIFNRFLGALKTQLERKWTVQRDSIATSAAINSGEKSVETSVRGHARQWSRKLRSEPIRLEARDGQETEPLSPAPPLSHADEGYSELQKRASRGFWVANAPWSVKKDGVSAALEFMRALIGYILMLAVMTYNIGFLFAVTGSVLLGEMVFGRYTRGSASLAEDGCHS
ncbi:Nn.00g091920.m01.CDS01 [Neocucurbitaria sp. VM-36]